VLYGVKPDKGSDQIKARTILEKLIGKLCGKIHFSHQLSKFYPKYLMIDLHGI
jgi:hypothetical protein